MLSMTYHLPPQAIAPGLDDDDAIDVFEAMLDLHHERARQEAHDANVAALRARWGGR